MKPNHSGQTPAATDWKNFPYRHWSPDSERYASAEVLLGYLRNGWEVENRVLVMPVYYSASRQSEMYFFELSRNGETIHMPVLGNPAVWRLMVEYELTSIIVHEEPEET